MGKGSQTTNTNQVQTYSPDPQAYSAIQTALQKGQGAANLPFAIPQAPVAGFSPDQLSAFQTVNNAQGMAQPYINQAQQYFQQGTQPNVSQFFNPYASAVTSQLNNIFGQQMAQTTGQLTQAAGGVGADRIAVGQANLANQQGLAAGQTLAGLYAPSLQAAQQQESLLQGAGYGTAALGSQAQNAALTGAQAQLGTGGLQQQLSQAQLNAPYQQQIAQAAFPYQQAQFLAGITGSLAPGLGGTTWGVGQSTPPSPSPLSQILGAGTAAAGIYGGFGGFGGSPSYGGGSAFSGDAYGGSGSNPLPGLTMEDYGPGFGRGGAANPYHYDEGGDVPDTPIDVAHQSIIPQEKLTPIQAHMPNLNLNPPSQQQSGSSPGIGDIIKTAASIVPFLASGGSITSEKMKTFDGHNPYKFFRGYDDGGDVPDDVRQTGNAMLRDAMIGHGYTPAISDQTRTAGMDQLRDAMTEKYGINPNDPYRMPSPDAVAASDAELKSRDPDIAASLALPPEIAAGTFHPAANPYADQSLSAYSAPDRSLSSASPSLEVPERPARDTGFIGSPWAALTAAGLGMMAGTSPFPGVNIGHGAMAGLKLMENQREENRKDETVDQAAKRLDQEVKFHEDQMKLQHLPYEQMTKAQEAQLEESRRQHELARIPHGYKRDDQGNLVFEPGGPYDPATIRAQADAKRLPAMSKEDMAPMVDAYIAGDHSVMTGVGRGAQGPQNIQQFWGMVAEKLHSQGADGTQIAAAKANFMAESAALRTAAVRESQIETAVNEAKGTFPQVLQRSAELPRGSFVPFNQALEYYRTQTGSPAQQRYGAAIQAAVTAYSQAMSRTGANSVYAQQHAGQILSGAQGPEAIKAAIEQLQIEMDIAKRAPQETRQATLDRILGKGAAAPDAGAAAAPQGAATLPPEAASKLSEGHVTTFGNGQKWMLRNGQPVQVQ